MVVSTIPILGVDVIGSILMIVLAALCLRLALNLRRRDKSNVIWTFLLWVCYALAIFSVSRSAGHILKQILLLTDQAPLWEFIRPVSGALNTFSFMVVASVTLFFQSTWRIYQGIVSDKRALGAARDELLRLNQNLENMIRERTRELAASEHKYRRIFELSKDMILVTGREGRIIDLNPIGHVMLGLDSSAAAGMDETSFRFFFARDEDWERVTSIILGEGSISNAEVDLKRADGVHIRSLITGTLDKEPADAEETIHFVIKDIERKRRMEQRMAQADKLASIGELSAGIAHEINNPIGVILGYTQLLIRKETPSTESYRDLKIIEKHVRSCKSVVEDLLNFARSSRPEKDRIDVHEVIDEAAHFIQQHTASEHVAIERDYAADLPPLVIDEKKIRQVFMNLIMNARHAVGDAGVIRISTRFRKRLKRVFIRISDTGYGIEEKNLSRIFDPFFTTKPTGEGTGLGLSVSYGIIKSHGGEIRVESASGEGSAFTVALPVDSNHIRSGG
ncbi:MAG: PAS domain S-box protein [Desulfobacterales bacterium]|nr:PAS domain S-box protein [Desulfobacterales bacterium]